MKGKSWSGRIRGPVGLLKHLISRYTEDRTARALNKFINLYLASSLFQRIFLLALIVLFYILAKELHADVKLYVAIVTILIGLYTIIKVIAGLCIYIVFCIKHGFSISPYKVIYIYTAKEIQKKIMENHWTVRLVLRMVMGNHKSFAREIAHSAVYNNEIKWLITCRLVYFVLILLAYMLGYNLLYEKLINIDFTNFFHPFTWAWAYLRS